MNEFLGTGDLEELQNRIDYFFNDSSILRDALTHKSYANEMNLENAFGNERLEFLGDAVLELVISHILMERFADASEGKLSQMRAAIVNKEELASLAAGCDIGHYMLLGRGEDESAGRNKESILSNMYEAIVAAVYCDGGYEKVFTVIKQHFSPLIEKVAEKGFSKDYKSRLQEYCQKTDNVIPQYIIVTEKGPDHVKIFETQVFINDTAGEKGSGRSKKAAEQDAARKTLEKLLEETV